MQRAIFDREAPGFAAAVASAITAIESSTPGTRVTSVERLDPAQAPPPPLRLITGGRAPGRARAVASDAASHAVGLRIAGDTCTDSFRPPWTPRRMGRYYLADLSADRRSS